MGSTHNKRRSRSGGQQELPLDVVLREWKYERIISLQNVTVALPFTHRIMDKKTPTVYVGGGWELLCRRVLSLLSMKKSGSGSSRGGRNCSG